MIVKDDIRIPSIGVGLVLKRLLKNGDIDQKTCDYYLDRYGVVFLPKTWYKRLFEKIGLKVNDNEGLYSYVLLNDE